MRIERDLNDNVELIEMGEAEGDAEVVAEAEAALKALAARRRRRRSRRCLSGEADGNDTFLEINAGAGGTESCDWAEMLARMYVRWAEAHGYQVELEAETPGDETGIKSAAYKITGPNAYGWLKTESRRAPAGADQPVRLRRQAADLLCQRLGLSGGGRLDRDRHPGQGYPHRHLPLLRRRRPAREQDRLGGPDHPLPAPGSW